MLCLISVVAGWAHSAVADERDLWTLWSLNTNVVADHAALVTACREYSAKSPQDPLKVVVDGVEAWHHLKMGNTQRAAALYLEMLRVTEAATPLQVAGAEMARYWLTRLDREQVRVALKRLYMRDIEYPVTLAAIKTLKPPAVPPLQDRWGKSWDYRQESVIKGMKSQRYVLESGRLGAGSDLKKALDVPYAAGIRLEPVKPSPIGNDTYEFSTPSQKSIFLQAGTSKDGVVVAYLGANLIVLSDGNHWSVALKTRK